jgi:hypothetical protein
MSGVGFYCQTPEVTLTAATADTVIGIAAAANHRVHVKKLWIGGKGVTVTNEPVTIEFIRFTGDGTGTAGTVTKRDADASETVEASFKHTYTVEPTGVTSLVAFTLHPQGLLGDTFAIEWPYPISGGDFWGIRMTADNAVNVIVTVECDE